LEKEARKFRGKRNSVGAKMAKFRGGIKDFKRSGGGIGDRDLSGKSNPCSMLVEALLHKVLSQSQ